MKIGSIHATAEYIRCRIVDHKEAPDVVAYQMKLANMPGAVCTKTLYNYIDESVIPGVSNESLWEKRKRRKQSRKGLRRLAKRISRGSMACPPSPLGAGRGAGAPPGRSCCTTALPRSKVDADR